MTLRHIVSWKLSGETLEERDAQADKAREMLAEMAEKIDLVKNLTAHRNELREGSNHDLVAIVDLDSDDLEGAALLEAYMAHPDHQAIIQYMGGATTARAGIDFNV